MEIPIASQPLSAGSCYGSRKFPGKTADSPLTQPCPGLLRRSAKQSPSNIPFRQLSIVGWVHKTIALWKQCWTPLMNPIIP